MNTEDKMQRMDYVQSLPVPNTVIDLLKTEFEIFQDIRVYGSNEFPLFVAKDAQKILGINRIRFTEDYKFGEDYIKIKILYDDKTREVVAFTEHGLYQLFYRTNSELGAKFRKFVTIILRELRIHKVVTLETAVNKLNQQLEEEHLKLIEATKSVEKFYNKWQDTQMETLKLQSLEKNRTVWSRGSPEYQLRILKERLFDRIYIYLEPSPKNSEIEEYDIDDEVGDDDIRIYSLSKTLRKRTPHATAYVYPKTKISAIEDVLTDFVLVKKGNKVLYHTSIETLIEEIDNICWI